MRAAFIIFDSLPSAPRGSLYFKHLANCIAMWNNGHADVRLRNHVPSFAQPPCQNRYMSIYLKSLHISLGERPPNDAVSRGCQYRNKMCLACARQAPSSKLLLRPEWL